MFAQHALDRLSRRLFPEAVTILAMTCLPEYRTQFVTSHDLRHPLPVGPKPKSRVVVYCGHSRCRGLLLLRLLLLLTTGMAMMSGGGAGKTQATVTSLRMEHDARHRHIEGKYQHHAMYVRTHEQWRLVMTMSGR